MIKSILATLILLTANAGLADDECQLADANFESDYAHSVEVVFEPPAGYTETGPYICWLGNTGFAIDELTTVPNVCSIVVEFDTATETLNCFQDMILPDGEKVVVHWIKVMH